MKIESVVEFVAADGQRFRDEAACLAYEAEKRLIDAIMAPLPTRDIPAGQYVQHDREVLFGVRRQLWESIRERYGKDYPRWLTWDADGIHSMSVVGRVLDDCENGPLGKAWRRLAKFNFDLCREYQQSYYALNPDKAPTRMAV